MSGNIISKIQELIDNEVGDTSRLQHILETINNNSKMYESDRKYLDSLIEKYFENQTLDKENTLGMSKESENIANHSKKEEKQSNDDRNQPKEDISPKDELNKNTKNNSTSTKISHKPRRQGYTPNARFTEFESNYNVDDAYKKIIKESNYGDFTITSTVRNEQISLQGKRSYSKGILITLIVVGLLLFLVGLLIAAIYYWTRPYQKIVIDMEPTDTGSFITIRTEGEIHNATIYELQKILNSKNN